MIAKILLYSNAQFQYATIHFRLKSNIQHETKVYANQKIREVLHTNDYTPKNSPPHKWNGKVKPIR